MGLHLFGTPKKFLMLVITYAALLRSREKNVVITSLQCIVVLLNALSISYPLYLTINIFRFFNN